MKKISLILATILLAITVKANHNFEKSELNLKLWNNSSFMVIFDNQTFNISNNLFLTDLTPGIHSLKVLKVRNNKYGNGGFKQVLYSGSIKIPKNTSVNATLTQQRQLVLALTKNESFHHHNNNNGYSSSTQHIHLEGVGCNEYYGCYKPLRIMGELEFNQLLAMLDDATFDSSKLSILKQVVLTNHFNVEQVAIIASQFTFDSNKLSFAKMAYSKTIDKQNYFLVGNVFTFNSSVENLNNFINQYS
jgi:hypothetical protein